MRLTKAKREQIVAAAIERSQPAQALKELQTTTQFELAEKCRVVALGGEEVVREIERAEEAVARATSKVPVEILSPAFQKRGVLNAQYVVGDKHNNVHLRFEKYEVFWGGRVNLKDFPKLNEDVRNYVETTDALNREISALTTEILEVVNSVSTVKRLLEVWPECEALLPEPAVTNLTPPPPAKTVAALNSALKLP